MAAPILWTEVKETDVNIANNTSVIKVDLYLQGNGESWNHLNPQGYINIDGSITYFNHNFEKNGSRQWLGSASKTVTHNADGTKSGTIKAGFNTGGYYGTVITSCTYNATVIPRATQPNVDMGKAEPGDTVTINLPRASSNFTHRIQYKMVDQEWQTLTNTASSNYKWVVPATVLDFIPTSTSGVAQIKVDTYNGSNYIGTKNTNITIIVPDSIVPVIESIKIEEAVPFVTATFGAYTQELSRLNLDIHTIAGRGSSIRSVQAVIDGIIYNQAKFTSNILSRSGELKIDVTITDNRGRSATKVEAITVIHYHGPRIADISLEQCDKDGTLNSTGACTKITVTGSVCPVNNKNVKKLVIKHKRYNEEVYSKQEVKIDYTFRIAKIIQNTTYDETNEFVVELTDSVSTVSETTVSGKVVISRLAGGDGVTFFKEAEEPGLWVGDIGYSMSSGFIKKWGEKYNSKNVLLENILNNFETDIKGLESKMEIELIPQSYVPFNGAWQVGEWQLIKIGRIIFMNFSIYAKVIADYLYQNITTSPIHESIRPSKLTTLSGTCMNEANKNVGTSCMVIKENGTINLISEKAVGWHKFSGILIC